MARLRGYLRGHHWRLRQHHGCGGFCRTAAGPGVARFLSRGNGAGQTLLSLAADQRFAQALHTASLIIVLSGGKKKEVFARAFLCGVRGYQFRRKLLRMQRKRQSVLHLANNDCNLLLLWITLDVVIQCCNLGEEYLSHAHAVSTYVVDRDLCSQSHPCDHICSAFSFSHGHGIQMNDVKFQNK